jgi:hypothetical protein
MNTIEAMQTRLAQVDDLAESALRKRDSLPIGSPERDEWNGIAFSCMREQRHLKSDIGRARQMASDVVSPR